MEEYHAAALLNETLASIDDWLRTMHELDHEFELFLLLKFV